MNKAPTRLHDAWIRFQGVAGPPCSRYTWGFSFPVTHRHPCAFCICFTPSATTENVLIHMELINFHLILLIIYVSYGRESPGGITHSTISLIFYLNGWQKAHLKQKQTGYKACSLEEREENDSIDKFWIQLLTLSGTSLAWSKWTCTPSLSEINSSTNTSFLCLVSWDSKCFGQKTSLSMCLASLEAWHHPCHPKSRLYPHPHLPATTCSCLLGSRHFVRSGKVA